jgi:hypothetical protein
VRKTKTLSLLISQIPRVNSKSLQGGNQSVGLSTAQYLPTRNLDTMLTSKASNIVDFECVRKALDKKGYKKYRTTIKPTNQLIPRRARSTQGFASNTSKAVTVMKKLNASLGSMVTPRITPAARLNQ